uniref:RING-type domain-containing protein n=1 Tax=Bubo bubo TaxID=30461 RepID=A0A8C0F5S2_BUBBB
MATETEQICPICRDAPRDNAYGLPCRHWFGLDCILLWLDLKRECPICRKQVEKVRFPVQEENDYIDAKILHTLCVSGPVAEAMV